MLALHPTKLKTDAVIKIKPETYTSLDLNPLRKFSDINGYSSLSNVTKKALRLLLNAN